MAKFSKPPVARLRAGCDPRFSPCGRYLLTKPSTTEAKLYAVEDWGLLHKLVGLKYPRRAAFDTNKGVVAIASQAALIACFSIETGQLLAKTKVTDLVDPDALEISPDRATLFLTPMAPHISVLDAGDLGLTRQLENPYQPTEGGDSAGACRGAAVVRKEDCLAALFRNGSQFVGGYRFEVVAWSLEDLSLVSRIPLPDEPASLVESARGTCVREVPDSACVAVTSAGDRATVLDVASGKVVRRLENLCQGDNHGELGIAFSQRTPHAAIAVNDRVDLYNRELTEVLGSLTINPTGFYGVDISPDGRYLAVSNGSTYVWETSQLLK